MRIFADLGLALFVAFVLGGVFLFVARLLAAAILGGWGFRKR